MLNLAMLMTCLQDLAIELLTQRRLAAFRLYITAERTGPPNVLEVREP